MQLSVQCFGGLRIEADGRGLGFAQHKSAALLAYLATTGRPAARTTLADLLWGEVPEPRARANLRVALTDVRKGLGDRLAAAVVADREQVWLDPALVGPVDVAAFDAAVDDGRWGDAVDRYRGPFLDGFFVDRAPGFEEWVAGTRDRFHRTALVALRGLADRRLADGDATGAVAALSRLVALEPWHEGGRRHLMQVLAGTGNPDAALDEYRRLRATLAEEVDAEPEPETVALAERIAGHGRSTVREDRVAAVPAPSAAIIGRDDDVGLVEKWLQVDGCRLATLTGPGGVGKTRLAQEVARRAGPGRVAFVDLSGVAAADEIPVALSQAVGVPLIGLREPTAEVAAALDGTGTLLVLDNLEHLLPAGSAVVAELLARCSSVQVLATSRTRLGLAAERVLRVRPLALPDAGAGADELRASPAVALFLRQAEAAGATVDPTGLGDVAELCRRLDGLPLAIELAAMHLRHFTAQEVLSTFGATLEELDDGGVERPARHRSLLDSVRWSYRMLDPSSRKLLRHLGVFRGGVALDVLAPGYRAAVVALLDAALLDRQDVAGRSRLTMMAATQAFALRALVDEGEAAEAAAGHAAAHLALARRADQGIRGHDQLRWLSRLDDEAENMAAALRHGAAHDPRSFLDLANSLAWFWNIRARFHEGGRWLLAAIDRSDGVDGVEPDRARALLNAALLFARRGQSPGGEALVDGLIDRADALVARLGDQAGQVAVDHLRAMRKLFLGQVDPGSVGEVIGGLRRGQQVLDGLGDGWGAGRIGFTVATLLFFHGDLDAMLAESEATRARFDDVGDRRGVGCVLNAVGLARVLLGDVAAGRRLLRQALEDLRAVGDYLEVINSFHVFGYSFLVEGRDVAAGARLLGAGARLCANSGLKYAATLQAEVDRVSAVARDRAGDAAWRSAWDDGWHAGLDVAVPD
ncbi:MAG TPA: BTAD domain-containing putative transcriptional regulator [Acidimicrobiales bacterium]|nr:BTAD domain-containing putative transcriptional regulator [Acidimicrobiales bacterium]